MLSIDELCDWARSLPRVECPGHEWTTLRVWGQREPLPDRCRVCGESRADVESEADARRAMLIRKGLHGQIFLEELSASINLARKNREDA